MMTTTAITKTILTTITTMAVATHTAIFTHLGNNDDDEVSGKNECISLP